MKIPSEVDPNDLRLSKYRSPICPRCKSIEGFHLVEVAGSGLPSPILRAAAWIWRFFSERKEADIYLQCNTCRFVFCPKRIITIGRVLSTALISIFVVFLFFDAGRTMYESWNVGSNRSDDVNPAPDPILYDQPSEPKPKVNVNLATLEELQTIPYLSERVKQAIIDNRPYVSLEDLKRVPGIKDRMLERIRPFVTLDENGDESSPK